MTIVAYPRYFSLFPRLKIKLKTDTIVVTEAESQAALNSLTENDFQDELKNGKTLITVHTGRRGLFRGQ
jgi:hypothetical protein